MAFITDTDFLIHNLRLSYLREVEDPYGPRMIAFDPLHPSNPYIAAASLSDSDRWPELAMPPSPHISEDEAERPSGYPGARLHYTQTVMGNKTGGFGIRVSGKRASTSKRMSGTLNDIERRTKKPVALSDTTPVPNDLTPQEDPNLVGEESAATSSSQPNLHVADTPVSEEMPAPKAVQFMPKFSRAAEMEARRKARMAARQNARPVAPQPPIAKPSMDLSSSDEDTVSVNDSSSDELGVSDQASSIDEADEFDPEFAMTRAANAYDSGSDAISEFSTSIFNASAPVSSSHTNGRQRPRLSPVDEGQIPQPGVSERSIDNNFVMLTPPPVIHQKEKYYPPRKLDTGIHNTRSMNRNEKALSNGVPSTSSTSNTSELTFTRRKIGPTKSIKSSLTAIMASSGSSNPFAELYAAVSGKGQVASINVQVYFPHTTQPSGLPLTLNVKKDASVEEVIGFSLWMYWEEKLLPSLDEDLSGEQDSRWDETMSTVRWVLRIAEMDGEVDDDFPPPDRMGKIARFNSEAYAIIEATPTQVDQNRIIHEKIYKRLDKPSLPGPNAPPAATSAIANSTLGGSVTASSYLGLSTNFGPQILLRIRIAEHADAVHVSTTIPVSAGMYLQEALELVCRKRRQMDPKDYALLLGDQSLLIPLDRTVASLQGKRELLLVKRSMLPQYGEDVARGIGKTTDPNASIFKRISDTPEVQFGPADCTTAYKKYTIYRKVPMLVAKQERTLAIDGVYVHIMASSRAKAVFDNPKTSSYHLNSIAQCKQSTKMTSVFKLVLNGRGAGNKRYDFEAESPKLAAEIVSTINNLKSALERSGTLNRSRRSKQIG